MTESDTDQNVPKAPSREFPYISVLLILVISVLAFQGMMIRKEFEKDELNGYSMRSDQMPEAINDQKYYELEKKGAFGPKMTTDDGFTYYGDYVVVPAVPSGAAANQVDQSVIGEEPQPLPDTLLPPDLWTCDYMVKEYQTYLDKGGKPEDWPLVEKTFEDKPSKTRYRWSDWLIWANHAKCTPGTFVTPEIASFGGIFPALIGSAAAIRAGEKLLFKKMGTGIDSPG